MRFLQLDVFGVRAGSGNPLGVVVGATHWSDADMQSFARWTGLVETTYLLPATVIDAHYRLRIFTPESEIAFAGHPTIGSAQAALSVGWPRIGSDETDEFSVVQQCEAGLLPINFCRAAGEALPLIAVRSPPARIVETPTINSELLAAATAGVALGQIAPTLVAGGRRWWIVECRDEASLRSWKPDFSAILALAREHDALGLCAFSRAVPEAGFDIVVRAFPAAVGIVEDPASGAANGLIAALVAARRPGGSARRGYRVSQGREMGHDAIIDIAFDHDGGIWVGGRSHVVLDGRLDWPTG